MGLRKAVVVGVIAGLAMGLSLFVVGALASRVVYGPQFAPAGKFEPQQLNAWHLLWTKLLSGGVVGLLLTVLYELLPLARRLAGVTGGLTYAACLGLVVYLYGAVASPDLREGQRPRPALLAGLHARRVSWIRSGVGLRACASPTPSGWRRKPPGRVGERHDGAPGGGPFAYLTPFGGRRHLETTICRTFKEFRASVPDSVLRNPVLCREKRHPLRHLSIEPLRCYEATAGRSHSCSGSSSREARRAVS
jgi:hypothetical protein